MRITENKTTDIVDLYNEKILAFDFSLIPDDLLTGKLGVILYLLSLYENTKESVYLDKIAELLEIIFENCDENTENNLYSNSSLSQGISGLGYVLSVLIKSKILDSEFGRQIDTISEVVYERTLKMISENNFGYFNGAIGNLFFLLSVNDNEKASAIIDVLFERSNTDTHLFNTEINDLHADGMNLGLNHGYLSTIKILLDFSKNDDKSVSIINKCLKTILTNLDYDYLVEGVHVFKPYRIYEENNTLKKHQNNRLCWSNSDLSFSYILHKAGIILNNTNYTELAETIGKETTKRRVFQNTGIENYHFCQGSSGVTQLYQGLFQQNPKLSYKESHGYWLDRTISYLESEKENPLVAKDLSLLYGKLGALMVINEEIDVKKYLKFLI